MRLFIRYEGEESGFVWQCKQHTLKSVCACGSLSAGDLPAEDPVHSLVYGVNAEPLVESAAVVLCVHALRGRDTCAMEAC